MVKLTPAEARRILRVCNIDFGADFHRLDSMDVQYLLLQADRLKYRTPKNAPGSRGRMFFQFVQRVAARPDPEAKPVASVHRFRNTVGVYVGSGETQYLTARQARELAKALTVAARSVEREKFTDSNVGTIEIR